MLANLGKRSRSGTAKGPRGPLCPHGKGQGGYFCKECPGKGICEHGRERHRCKECGGGSICEHGRERRRCKECGGSSICEHGRRRTQCKECGGGSICEHGRERHRCKECGGGSICEHGRVRHRCKECGGSQICEHGRQRSHARSAGECGGVSASTGGSTVEYLRAPARCKECYLEREAAIQVQGVRGLEHLRAREERTRCEDVRMGGGEASAGVSASTGGGEQVQGVLSASTGGSDTGARSAGREYLRAEDVADSILAFRRVIKIPSRDLSISRSGFITPPSSPPRLSPPSASLALTRT